MSKRGRPALPESLKVIILRDYFSLKPTPTLRQLAEIHDVSYITVQKIISDSFKK